VPLHDTRQDVCANLLRLCRCAQVGLHGFVARKNFVGVFVGNGTCDDDIVTLLPIGGSCDLVLRSELYGVQHADDFVEVAAGGHGVSDLQLDALVRADDKDRAHRGVVGGSAALAGIACVAREHVVELRDGEGWVADERVIDLVATDVLNVLFPFAVALDGVDGEPDDLSATLCKLLFEPGDGSEFGGANGSEIFGVREENGVAVSNPFMKVDRALSGFSVEIGGNIVDAE